MTKGKQHRPKAIYQVCKVVKQYILLHISIFVVQLQVSPFVLNSRARLYLFISIVVVVPTILQEPKPIIIIILYTAYEYYHRNRFCLKRRAHAAGEEAGTQRFLNMLTFVC